MTAATGTGVPTQAELLYVCIDLGARPALDDYGRNVAALVMLARYATFLTHATVWGFREDESTLPEPDVRVLRTSLASPWVTVLEGLARNSPPVALTVTGLYALHRVLKLVMTWQRHRMDIAERNLQLRDLGRRLHLEHVERLVKLHAVESDALRSAAPLPDSLAKRIAEREARAQEKPIHDTEDPAAFAPSPHLDAVVQAAQDLGEIQAVELISPEDPRTTGFAEK